MSFPSFSSFPVEQLQDAVQYSSFPAVEDAKDDQAAEQGEIVLSTIHKKKKHKADKKLKSNKDKVGGDGLGAGEYLNFYKDLKPNFNNVKYQTISNTAIPHYKRFGTQVLGYEVQIARGSNDQKRLILEYEAKSEVYKRYAKITPNPIKVKVGSCITNEFDEGHMFIQVNNDEFEIDVQPDTNPDFNENVEFRARTAEIDLQIQHDPSNVTAWLKLVSLQESMLPLSNKQSTKKFIVEKQLAILDKALSHVQTDTLLSAYMNTFQQFENYQNVMRKWSEILNKYPNSYNLWFGYLNFRQTAASQFILSDVVDLYIEAINTLSARKKDEKDEANVLHLFVRAATMLGQAGYSERAVALFQALIEFNLFAPKQTIGWPFLRKLNAFQDFWDKECPRFGEDGALGWRNSMDLDAYICTDEQAFSGEFEDIEDQFKRFYLNELSASFDEWFPKRGLLDVEDPFKSVLFEDIKPLLFDIKSETVKHSAIYSMLQYLGLDAQMGVPSSIAYSDPFLCNNFSSEPASKLFMEGDDDVVQLNMPMHRYPNSLWNLLGCMCPAVYESNNLYTISQFGLNQLDGVNSILSQSRDILPDFISSHLLMLQSFTESAEKKAKSYLKAEPGNLILWVTYAHILVKNEKLQQAQQIYQTALSMLPTLPSQSRSESVILYSMYAAFEHSTGHMETCRDILVAYTESSYKVSPADNMRISQAKLWFKEQLKLLVSTLDVNCYSVEIEKCLLHIDNYTSLVETTESIEAAAEIHAEIISTIQAKTKGSVLEELVDQQFARKVYNFAITSRSFKPSLLRGVLETALESFPLNTLLISVYAWNEARTKIENRTRRFISDHCGKTGSHTVWLFSLWSEFHQRQNINHSVVKSLFESSVDSTAKSCPSIWVLYLHHAFKHDPTKAKNLCLQAVACVPWVKEIYMIAFHHRDAFEDHELNQMLELMNEKEIRIRKAIDE